MQVKSTTTSPALKALLENLIDYAGVFPPASVSFDEALANYNSYRVGDHDWMLRWLVLDAAELPKIPDSFDGRLSLLSDADQTRAAAVETKAVIAAQHPVYCEVPVNKLDELDSLQKGNCFAKIRTGGLKPEAIPSPGEVAAFILACAERKLPFKATAGLHHPIRAEQALTYKPDAPRAVMHGFINVLMASAFAWNGERDIEDILSEMDPKAFKFDESAQWKDKSLSIKQISDTRQNFMHSIGSCSFTEPVQELQQLGFLP